MNKIQYEKCVNKIVTEVWDFISELIAEEGVLKSCDILEEENLFLTKMREKIEKCTAFMTDNSYHAILSYSHNTCYYEQRFDRVYIIGLIEKGGTRLQTKHMATETMYLDALDKFSEMMREFR